MFFIHTLIEDVPEILQPMITADTLGEPLIFSSCINPLSVILSIAEESNLEPLELCETFNTFLENKADVDTFGFDLTNIDITPELMVEWIAFVTERTIGVTYDEQDLLDMVVRKNTEAIHELYFKDVGGIQIVLNPANEKGNTLSIAGDFRADSLSLANKLCDVFGEFVMVCFPIELIIGPTGHRINQYICHVYNDTNRSFARGMIMQGHICEKCGEFYTIFPGQTEFCCGI